MIPGRPASWVPLLLPLLLGGGCRPDPPSPELGVAELRVEYSGCTRVRQRPVCVVADLPATLRLWVEATPGTSAATVTVSGTADPSAPGVEVLGGRRFEVRLEKGATIEVRIPHGGTAGRWRLPVVHQAPPEWYREARELGRQGRFEEARRKVLPRAIPEQSSERPEERGAALWLLANLEMNRDPQRAEEALRQALTAWRESGDLSEEIRVIGTLVFVLMNQHRFAEARAFLDAAPDPQGHGDSLFALAQNRGQAAVRAGDLRSARRQLRQAVAVAERLALPRGPLAQGPLLDTLARLGRFEAAARLSQDLAAALAEGDLPPCPAARLHNDRAWGLLLAREAGEGQGAEGASLEDPEPLLRQALETIENHCPEAREDRVNLRLNLALAALQEERPAEARRWLSEAATLRDASREAETRWLEHDLWWQDLEARLDLATGNAAGAVRRYQALEQQARRTLAPEARWRAVFGLAQARQALGDRAAALEAYARADRLLEEEILLVPMHHGRDTFVASRQRATRRYLELLLSAEPTTTGPAAEQALAVLRRQRSRYLRSLRRFVEVARLAPQERRRWDRTVEAYRQARRAVDEAAARARWLPGDERQHTLRQGLETLRHLREELDRLLGGLKSADARLVPRRPGELILALHPLEESGESGEEWLALAADDAGTRAHRLPKGGISGSAAEVAARLLEPFRRPIADARRLRVLATGSLATVDFHALPWHGDPLLAALPVVYGADLARPATPPSPPPRILVVGDPRGNLPSAQREARAVATAGRRLSGKGGEVRMLLAEEATGTALRAHLEGSGWFHYAGHGVFAGWDSYLPLARGGRFTLDDIMALERGPKWVVLSGCETARGEPLDGTESISLAHAFLTAGSAGVVAAVRPVRDADTPLLFAAFYDALNEGAEPPEALRRAQLALRDRHPDADWAAFRMIVP